MDGSHYFFLYLHKFPVTISSLSYLISLFHPTLLLSRTPRSWLTGGTTIGSGLTYLAGEGTGNLLLKKLKLKKGEVAVGTTDSNEDINEKTKGKEKK